MAIKLVVVRMGEVSLGERGWITLSFLLFYRDRRKFYFHPFRVKPGVTNCVIVTHLRLLKSAYTLPQQHFNGLIPGNDNNRLTDLEVNSSRSLGFM